MLAHPSSLDYTFVQDFITKFIVEDGKQELWKHVVEYTLPLVVGGLQSAVKGEGDDVRILVVVREMLLPVLYAAKNSAEKRPVVQPIGLLGVCGQILQVLSVRNGGGCLYPVCWVNITKIVDNPGMGSLAWLYC